MSLVGATRATPASRYAAGLAVHVVLVHPGDPPSYFTGTAVLRADGGVRQTRLQEASGATTHAQAVMAGVQHLLESLPTTVAGRITIFVPDRPVVDLLNTPGRTTTPKLQSVLADVRRLHAQKCPEATFAHGRFADLAQGRDFFDRWG